MNRRPEWFTQAHTLHRVVQIDARRVATHTLLLGTLVSLLLLIPFVIYHQSETANRRAQLQADQARVVKLAKNAIRQEMSSVVADLSYLAQHNEIRTFLDQPGPEGSRELAHEYRVLARQKRMYESIQFIDVAGRERVCVSLTPDGFEVELDAPPDVEGTEGGVKDALRLAPGEILGSPLLYVRKGGRVTPVVRFSTPVTDAQGRVRGVVSVNYLIARLEEKLRDLETPDGEVWLLGPSGKAFTVEPSSAAAAAESQQRRTRAAALWKTMQSAPGKSDVTVADWIRLERLDPLHASAAAIPAGSRHQWTLVAALSESAVHSAEWALLQNLAMVYAVLVGFAFLAAGTVAFGAHRNRALTEVMERIMDNLPQLIAYVDSGERYRFNNMAYERFSGLSPKRIYGRTMREVLGDVAHQRLSPYVARALAGEAVNFETRLDYGQTGERDMAVNYLPDFSPQGDVRGFYVMVNDVTLLKESERRERQRILETARISRATSLGEMAAEIAHEINQPLAAMAMYSAAAQRVLERGHDPDLVKTWLEAINTQAKRASEIVRRVRRFVQKEEAQFGAVDLNQVVRDAIGLVEPEAQTQQVKVTLMLAADVPTVQGERLLLEQAIFQLARRALEATLPRPDGRQVTVTTSVDAQAVHFAVADNGNDLDPALGDQIFDSFLSSMEHNENMGLIISRTVIEAHAGTLRYIPNPGGGTIFMFSLARGDVA